MQLKLTKRTVDGILAIECNGGLCWRGIALLRDEVKKAIGMAPSALCSTWRMNYIDSSGLGTLVALHTSAQRGASIKLANLNKRITDLLQITSC